MDPSDTSNNFFFEFLFPDWAKMNDVLSRAASSFSFLYSLFIDLVVKVGVEISWGETIFNKSLKISQKQVN